MLKASAEGVIPTPNSMDHTDVAELWGETAEGIRTNGKGNERRKTKTGSDFGMKLPVFVKQFPTVCAGGFSNQRQVRMLGRNESVSEGELKGMTGWKNTRKIKKAIATAGKKRKDTKSGLLPTPAEHDATPGGPNNHYKGLGHSARHGEARTEGCRLSPEWTEALMGWPVGWTALGPLSGGEFPRWLAGFWPLA